MSPPTSHSRILAALKRLSPVFPLTDVTTRVGKELSSIATALGMAADRVDAVLAEIFPDTTEELIERWELVTKVPTRTADDIDVRRGRVLSVLRRSSGARLDQLAKMLAVPFDLDELEVTFVEVLREWIDEALTEESSLTLPYALPTSAPALQVELGKHWPGEVDSFGVHVYVALSASTAITATLTSPRGTSWTVPVEGLGGWFQTREDFLGELPGGTWKLDLIASGGANNLTEQVKLLVSNDVDSSQIYNFYALRDPALSGTPDLVEAQRLFRRTALGHMRARVIEHLEVIVDDDECLVDRDPVGV